MNHEKLICYQEAVDVAQKVGKEIEKWPRGYGYLSDQLRRAITSVVLNIAEGNGRSSKAERKRFFQIARGSAAEVAACVDLMIVFHLTQQGALFKEKLDSISKMLYFLH